MRDHPINVLQEYWSYESPDSCGIGRFWPWYTGELRAVQPVFKSQCGITHILTLLQELYSFTAKCGCKGLIIWKTILCTNPPPKKKKNYSQHICYELWFHIGQWVKGPNFRKLISSSISIHIFMDWATLWLLKGEILQRWNLSQDWTLAD